MYKMYFQRQLFDQPCLIALKFLQEMKAELAYLAHHCCEIDKYRVETCCILGELALHIKIVFFNGLWMPRDFRTGAIKMRNYYSKYSNGSRVVT